MMSLVVSKDCFPTPSKCHNCERKGTEVLKKETGPKEEYKRCADCHIMTYCDKDCQKEHWTKVHKQHCRFLSGKCPVENSIHNAGTCTRCKEDRETSTTLKDSEKSAKTYCNIQPVLDSMKKSLSIDFGFHGQEKNCNCSLEYGLQLPFPLGEVSGQYLEIAGTGLDALLGHALKITHAMGIKAKNEELTNSFIDLFSDIIEERVDLWYDILVCGKPRRQVSKPLFEKTDNLEAIYGASNPWWKSLVLAVNFVISTKKSITSNFRDLDNMKDPRFQKLKQMHLFNQSHLQNQATVCEKKMWSSFMLWPQMVNGSLTVLLPPGAHCQTCNYQLSGQVAVTPYQSMQSFLPCLFQFVGDDGGLVACCSPARKPSCLRDYVSTRNVEIRMSFDEDLWKEVSQEDRLFLIEARDCDFCLKLSLSSHRCSACLTVQYCSTVCQKKDLGFHKTVCATWAKDESRVILGKRKQKNYWRKNITGEK